jgi:hypothetical protein
MIMIIIIQNTDSSSHFDTLTEMSKEKIEHINLKKEEKLDQLKNYGKCVLLFFYNTIHSIEKLLRIVEFI